MTEISANMAQPSTRWQKTKKHLVNAGVTAGGIGATTLAGRKLSELTNMAPNSLPPRVDGVPMATVLTTRTKIANAVYNTFSKLGEKIFNKNNFLHYLFERYEIGSGCHPVQLDKCVKNNKTYAAILLTGAVTALGFLAHGIYKAGKINGEGK